METEQTKTKLQGAFNKSILIQSLLLLQGTVNLYYCIIETNRTGGVNSPTDNMMSPCTRQLQNKKFFRQEKR